uniref:Uncharacterized protein n=1 Tax=Oryza glumipatula TaxID=40148 RepID=A0A0E0ATD1_9ORYZ
MQRLTAAARNGDLGNDGLDDDPWNGGGGRAGPEAAWRRRRSRPHPESSGGRAGRIWRGRTPCLARGL